MKIPRLPWQKFFMLQAHLIATRSTCDRGPELLFDPGRHGVGCVIVRDNRVIAGGFNGSPPGLEHCDAVGHLLVDNHCVRTVHSESNALIQCALDGVSPEGATLYTTASPCYDCAKLIIRARIREVIFGESYESRYGLSGDVERVLDLAHIKVAKIEIKREDLDHLSSKVDP